VKTFFFIIGILFWGIPYLLFCIQVIRGGYDLWSAEHKQEIFVSICFGILFILLAVFWEKIRWWI
jgi:hypothetical protein